MGFIPVIKVYGAFAPQPFKLLQLPKLVSVELRRGFALWTFPYTSKSCANALKKRLSVSSQAVFPVAASHCALADNMLERSFSVTCRMTSPSCVPIIGLRPRPGLVASPLMPSASKRFTQLLTVVRFMSKRSPICGELKPCAFNSTALHRIRKACDEPLRYPFFQCGPLHRSQFYSLDFAHLECVPFYGYNGVWAQTLSFKLFLWINL